MEASELVLFIDRVRREQRISQMAITDLAGINDTGQTYYRMWTAMDGKISTMLKFLHALGYEVRISKQGESDGADHLQS